MFVTMYKSIAGPTHSFTGSKDLCMRLAHVLCDLQKQDPVNGITKIVVEDAFDVDAMPCFERGFE